jgi:immunity protein 50 of polymorphic toxin system
MVDVLNGDALEERFGGWPSFHDAEVLAVRLDSGQRSDGRTRLELDIHLFDIDGLLPSGHYNFVNHTLATFEFVGVENVELDDFGPQNVLDGLVIEKRTSTYSAARIHIELPSNNGLGGAFDCEEVLVGAVEPHTPGIHSVYRRLGGG